MSIVLTTPPEPEASPEFEQLTTDAPASIIQVVGVPSIPHSREAEEATLGGVFINGDSISEVFDVLQAPDFYIHRHQWIYESMVRLFCAGVPIDLLTVSDDMEKAGTLKAAGGPAYLTALVNQAPSSLNVVHYASIVEGYSLRRKWIQQANDKAQLAYDLTLDIDAIEKRLEIVEQNPLVPTKTTNVTAKEAGGRLKEQLQSGKPQSVPSGIVNSDKIYGGFEYKKITILIGDNSVGKTARMLQSCEALNFAGGRSLYITLEEPVEGMVSRRVFGQTGIEYVKWRNGTLTPGEKAQLEKEIDSYISTHPFIIFNETARTIRAIRRAVKQGRPKLVVVDDLWHVYMNDGGGDNEASGLMRIASGLKDIAIDENCAVVILHHLTAEEANKLWPGGKKPTQNTPPALDSMTWSKNLRFTVDMWLALVPDWQADIKADVVKTIEWMMKDKRGKRLHAIELFYDKIQQWFYDNTNVGQMQKYNPVKPVVSQMPSVAPINHQEPLIVEPDDEVVFTEEEHWLAQDMNAAQD